MLNFDAWLGTNNNVRPSATDRAIAAWDRIQDKPSPITIERGQSTTLAAQTVRIEANQETREVAGGAGKSSVRQITLFGIKDHPTQADTNIQRGDRFTYLGSQYRVIDLIHTLGEVQARAEAGS